MSKRKADEYVHVAKGARKDRRLHVRNLQQVIALIEADDEETAIQFLQLLDRKEIVKFKQLLLNYAFLYRFFTIMGIAVDLGANLEEFHEDDEFSDLENTFLHIAAESDDSEMILALYQLGARIDAQNDAESTALIVAVENGCIQAACQLIELGADPWISNLDAANALETAADSNNLEMLAALEQALANQHLDIRDSFGLRDGWNILHRAVNESDFDTIRFLVDDLGLDPGAVHIDGRSPISYAKNIKLKAYLTKANANKTSLEALNKHPSFGHDRLNLDEALLDDLIQNLATNPTVKTINFGITPLSEEALVNLLEAIQENTNLLTIIFSEEVEEYNEVKLALVDTIAAIIDGNCCLVENRSQSLSQLCAQEMGFFAPVVARKPAEMQEIKIAIIK